MAISLEPRFVSRIRMSRRRVLPQPGQVLVHLGDVVRPQDIVARSIVASGIQIVDAARALGISRGRLAQHFVVTAGQLVEPGEELAVRPVLGKRAGRACRSPIAGRVVDLSDGYVFLQVAPRALNREACIAGTVSRVTPLYGATITGDVAWMQGIWGRGSTAWAPINVVVETRHDPLTWKNITESCRGTIVVGGTLVDRSALLRAEQYGAAGLVSGGIDPDLLLGELGACSLPVVVTEGAGEIPMAAPLFELFLGYQERHATISGGEDDGWEMPRPEVLIPLEGGSEVETASLEQLPLEAGDTVRLTQPPRLGLIGQVTDPNLPDVRFESGLHGPGIEVELPNQSRTRVFPTNVELLRI